MAGLDASNELRALFEQMEQPEPAKGLWRLWKTGRGAAGLGAAVLRSRLRGEEAGISVAETQAILQLTSRLGELKGVAMKAGQILSYVDISLPDELRNVLAVLQTHSPATPFPRVEEVIRESLGARAPALLERLCREPIAVASIGQVHRGYLPDGTEVAVKVRHPGIDAALRTDFGAAGAGSSLAMLIMPGARASIGSIVEEARQAILEECDFALEAERQDRFASLYADDATILVPAVERAWCGPSVLTTRWLTGSSFEAFLAASPSQERRNRVSVALFSFYFGTLYRHGLFHADPHPGNYAFRDDGRVLVYDFGCVRSFEKETVVAFAALASAVRRDDRRAMAEAVAQLGGRLPESGPELEQTRTLLRSFFSAILTSGARPVDPGAGSSLRDALKDKRTVAKLALPGKLLFLFRLRFGLHAVLARLGAVADWAALESGWAEEVLGLRSTGPS